MIIDVSNINPVAFSIGFVKIHWYGLAYAVGILLGFKFSMMMAKKFNKSITAKQIDNFFYLGNIRDYIWRKIFLCIILSTKILFF